MKKLIILDKTSSIVYIISYDTNIYEYPEDCIIDAIKHNLIGYVNINKCSWMVCDEVNIKVV